MSLRWEASYPDDWGAGESWMWSPWTGKEVVLRRLDRGGVPDPVRSQVADLVLAAMRRPYRCKDWMYAPLVRHIRDDALVSRLDAMLDADDPLVRAPGWQRMSGERALPVADPEFVQRQVVS